ncbi:MAG: HEPN domain-containing protein [Dehalococcoidia bacterium]
MSVQDQELAQEWFAKAEHDLAAVDGLLAGAVSLPDIVCFHCHLVGEKYLKGLLAWHARTVTKIYNLLELLHDCAALDRRFAALNGVALTLNAYAIDTRYPGMPNSNPSIQEALTARDAAREIRRAVRLSLGLPTT